MKDDDNAPTQLYEKATWLKPVLTASELPSADVPEGAQCFVSDKGEIYRFTSGSWALVAEDEDDDAL